MKILVKEDMLEPEWKKQRDRSIEMLRDDEEAAEAQEALFNFIMNLGGVREDVYEYLMIPHFSDTNAVAAIRTLLCYAAPVEWMQLAVEALKKDSIAGVLYVNEITAGFKEGISLEMMRHYLESANSAFEMCQYHMQKKRLRDNVTGSGEKKELRDSMSESDSKKELCDNMTESGEKKELHDSVSESMEENIAAVVKAAVSEAFHTIIEKMQGEEKELRDNVTGSEGKKELRDNVTGSGEKKELRDNVTGSEGKKELRDNVTESGEKKELRDNVTESGEKKELRGNVSGSEEKKELRDNVTESGEKKELRGNVSGSGEKKELRDNVTGSDGKKELRDNVSESVEAYYPNGVENGTEQEDLDILVKELEEEEMRMNSRVSFFQILLNRHLKKEFLKMEDAQQISKIFEIMVAQKYSKGKIMAVKRLMDGGMQKEFIFSLLERKLSEEELQELCDTLLETGEE